MMDTNEQAVMPALEMEVGLPTAIAGAALPADAARRQEAIVALGRRAVAPPALSILLQDAAALLAEMFDSEFSGVAEVLPDGGTLRHHLTSRDEAGDSTPCDHQETVVGGGLSLPGYAIEAAHPVVVADLGQEHRFTDLFLRRHGIVSAVAAPLRLRGEAFGALGAYSTRRQHFHKDDVLFMETISHLIATTIGRCRA
ncbi:MAG: GAF domain-containing protein, partial [Patescibacteria group bacterium]|nr:GAF domain-containing protein [Patescibacteria group bacterium]